MSNRSYSFRDLLTMDACSGCRLCADACPAVSASGNGQLSGVYRLHELKKLQQSRAGIFKRFFAKRRLSETELKEFSDTVFRCTLCGNCQEICPVGIRLRDIWLSLRQDLVHSSAYPKKIDMILENLSEAHNVFAEDNEERADWVEDMREAPDHGYIKEKAEVVYFTGCVAAYFPMVQKIPMSLVRILASAGVDFTLLGADEWCCGFPLLGAGLSDKTKDVIDHNVEVVKSKGAEKIVFACPSCYQMWREHYPAEFKLFHYTEYMRDLIAARRISFSETALTVTYHDPCDLGRGAKEYDAPRDVIRSLPGVTLVEMAHNRNNCLCCGGGGNLEMIDAGLSSDIAEKKIKDIVETGASTVLTSCQQCVRAMNTYVRRNKIPLEVLDLSQLVEKVLAEKPAESVAPGGRNPQRSGDSL